MIVWGKNTQTGLVGRVGECGKRDMQSLLCEYRKALGEDWIVWAGLKRECPARLTPLPPPRKWAELKRECPTKPAPLALLRNRRRRASLSLNTFHPRLRVALSKNEQRQPPVKQQKVHRPTIFQGGRIESSSRRH